MNTITRNALVSALILSPAYAMACASCGCTLSSDWDSQGFVTEPGLRLDLRYDYLNQSQLRSGTGSVNRSNYPAPQEREIEQGTKNNYLSLGLDYSPNADWGVNLQLPYIDRSHSTIAPGDTEISSSHTKGIGDLRVVGRYQGLTDAKNMGLQFGLKLATGGYHNSFNGGPQAAQALDRGLQPGSGTTDLLLGAYTFGPIDQRWDYFAQGLVQVALNSKEEYRQGSSLNVNFGVRYTAIDHLSPQLQINARSAKRDAGLNADADNSGGTLVYLSPGLTVSMTKQAKIFGFLQLPVYQKVNGFQLAPRWTASVGVRYEL
ncbi:TonB-dependent receptor [Undibacterium sp. Jales W-56]|uniref:TonB-dependent receptor n=1 Tax=Undibacterium sp. Jales W-56 TaxID=2897325 RepID=UPI0021D396BD|nr:TonB-dependent receptor [Undibacterium sp. Jales W-56]MCU6433975.1 TonB-dependent receptor [Undibacterium sp. Jales W-56]